MDDDDFIDATFSGKDWERIAHALNEYVRITEETLKQQNVGDREWNEVGLYDCLAKDIELFVIPLGKQQ
jgi:hypothetical protein